MSTHTSSATLTEIGPAESVDEIELGAQFGRANAVTAVSNRSISSAAASIRAQVELLEYMRRKGSVLVEPERVRHAVHLVWRLMLATSFAVVTATVGAVLTVAVFVGGSLSPNPFVALSVLFAGIVLTVTLAAAVRSG